MELVCCTVTILFTKLLNSVANSRLVDYIAYGFAHLPPSRCVLAVALSDSRARVVTRALHGVAVNVAGCFDLPERCARECSA
jgi:hypothetical protein